MIDRASSTGDGLVSADDFYEAVTKKLNKNWLIKLWLSKKLSKFWLSSCL